MFKVEGHCLCLQPNMGEQITSSCTWDLGAQLKCKTTGVLKAIPQSRSWNWEASLGLCVGSTENAGAVGVIWATPHPSHCPSTHGLNGAVTSPLSDTCYALQNFSSARRPDTPAHEPCGSCKQGLYLRSFWSLQMQEMLMVTHDWLAMHEEQREVERRYRWQRKRGEAWLFPESLGYLQQTTSLSIAQHLGEYGSACLIEPLLG